MIGFAPGVTTTSSGENGTPRVSATCLAIASRSSGSPADGPQCVAPASSARLAASLMCAGVSKSGSPISRWTISRPARSSALARASTSNADSVPSLAIRAATLMACLSQATHGGRVLTLRCKGRPTILLLLPDRNAPILATAEGDDLEASVAIQVGQRDTMQYRQASGRQPALLLQAPAAFSIASKSEETVPV